MSRKRKTIRERAETVLKTLGSLTAHERDYFRFGFYRGYAAANRQAVRDAKRPS